ncbi:hypothetical protein DBR11_11420 [Pedobacter sp. HMWF019]|uniref:hypothetical protein n=1 Tax=Pedobacter sp. HMWF019 TaxID=2056856 RepID=UPI000D338FD6|nr:hypothetical protein [Pedobacter sp. HMWF019]PTS99875.1 hypothetical protein DBR11_11420 [Pedobacter sp. HMWF019]
MKKILIILFPLFIAQGVWTKAKADSIAELLIQLGLNVDKWIQLKGVLSDMKAGYKIVSKGYGTVKDLSEGNFNIHKVFLDALMQVSPTVAKYPKIPKIVEYQIHLVKEYKAAFNRFKRQGNFSAQELKYVSGVYENLFNQSLENLDELISVTTAGKMRMSDDERLRAIDRIYVDMEDKVSFLHSFNDDTALLSLQREKKKFEINSSRRLQGINTQQ